MHIERHGDVALLRMQLGKANAIGPEFLDAMHARLDELGPARALVVTGYESFFSAGLDLPSLIGLDEPKMRTFIARFSATMLRLFRLELPVVAALNGHAVAGGCVLALQADLRLAADVPLKIGLNEVPLGIGLPAVVLETLRAQVPPASMLPIALEGRLVDATEALKLGLLHEVYAKPQLLERALARASELARLPPAAFAQVKRNLRAPIAESVERASDDPARWTSTWFTPEAQERIRATVARLKK